MENKKNGWAFGLGIYGGAYQLFAGLILLIFCSKIGGIPYGIALILSGLAAGTVTFFTRRQKWARIALLFLGVAGVLLVFALGFLVEKVGGFKQGADSIVLLLRVICFNPAIALFLAGIWGFELADESKKKKFLVSSIVYKVALLLGVAVCAIVSALTFWQMTNNAAFTEWLYGVLGDESLTGSALIEAQILLRADFAEWARAFTPLFEGIGILLITMIPSYAWYLDSEGILFGGKKPLCSIIVTAVAAPFLIVAEILLIGSFISTGSIASLIFGIVTLLALGAAWFFYYAFPAIRGNRPAIFYEEEYVFEDAEEA